MGTRDNYGNDDVLNSLSAVRPKAKPRGRPKKNPLQERTEAELRHDAEQQAFADEAAEYEARQREWLRIDNDYFFE